MKFCRQSFLVPEGSLIKEHGFVKMLWRQLRKPRERNLRKLQRRLLLLERLEVLRLQEVRHQGLLSELHQEGLWLDHLLRILIVDQLEGHQSHNLLQEVHHQGLLPELHLEGLWLDHQQRI